MVAFQYNVFLHVSTTPACLTCNKAMTKVQSRFSATLLTALVMSKVVAESRPLEIASMNLMGFGLQIISPN